MFMTVGEGVSDGLHIDQPCFQLNTPLTWEDKGYSIEAAAEVPKIAHPQSPVEPTPGARERAHRPCRRPALLSYAASARRVSRSQAG